MPTLIAANPLQFQVCSTSSFLHTGLHPTGAADDNATRAVLIFKKTTSCMARADGNGRVCYASKSGVCKRFRDPVWAGEGWDAEQDFDQQSAVLGHLLSPSDQQLNVGEGWRAYPHNPYSACDPDALAASEVMLKGK